MNAVNLIPGDGRTRRLSVSTSPQTLGLFGGLVLVLLGVVLYVTAANKVSSRKSELAQVSTGVAQWTAAGNSYAGYVASAAQRTQQLDQVRQLATSRFPWSDLLGQIGGLMPRDAALSTFAASTAPAVSASSTTAAPPTTSTTGTTSTTSTTATTAGATAPTAATGTTDAATVPTVQLTGCAASQSAVARTMTQLHQVRNVTAVSLASSTESADPGSGAASTGTNTGGCPFPVQFQISLTFGPSSAGTGTTSTASAAGTTAPAATTSTPATTTSTPAATTSTPAATTSTPAATASATTAPASSTTASAQ